MRVVNINGVNGKTFAELRRVVESRVESFFVKPRDAIIPVVSRDAAKFIANRPADKIRLAARLADFFCKLKFRHNNSSKNFFRLYTKRGG